MNQEVIAKGVLHITVTRENGTVEEYHFKNLVVNVGLAYLANRAISNTATIMGYMAVGTNNAAPSANQTALSSENGRVALYSATNAGPAISFVANFPPGTATGTLQEAGIFDQAAGGSMLCRSLFTNPINKSSGDAVNIIWTTTLSA